MVQQNVLLRQDLEIVRRFAQHFGKAGRERWEYQIRPVDHAAQLHHASQVDRAGDVKEILGLQVELVEQELHQVVGTFGCDLEAHRAAEPARVQLAAQRPRQILHFGGIEVEIRIPSQPELMAAGSAHARE